MSLTRIPGPRWRRCRSTVSLAVSPVLLLVSVQEARATPPPQTSSSEALDRAWARTEGSFQKCSDQMARGGRAGAAWIDVLFPSRGKPTFEVRTSPNVTAADRACVSRVVSRSLMPALGYHYVAEPIRTLEVSLGVTATYLPPLSAMLSDWSELSRRPNDHASRARLERRVKPMATIARDGCLLVRDVQRLQASRKQWLAAAGTEVPFVWQSIVDAVGRTHQIAEPAMFVDGGTLLLAGFRIDDTVRYRALEPPSWSRRWSTYCLKPLDANTVREMDRRVDDVAACVAGTGAERLAHPRLDPPPNVKLHAVSVSERRYCGLDQAGAIVCCGVRSGTPPQGTFTELSTSDHYGCGVRSSGEVACWGEAAPGATPPPGRFSRISVAGGGACAINDQRAIVCWGVHSILANAPSGNFVDVALTPLDAHAVATDGSVVTWGNHAARRAMGARKVVASSCEVCALTGAGQADCVVYDGQQAHVPGPLVAFAPRCPGGCGVRRDGALECGSDPSAPPPPAVASGRYTDIASTEGRFCATSIAGQVTCWGTPWPGKWLSNRFMTGAAP
jgi:hypothetical protein